MEVVSWNLSGVDLVKLPDCLRDVGRIHGLPFLNLQELPRGTTGWQTYHVGGWEICACQPADMWRGIGIGFDPTRWALLRRKRTSLQADSFWPPLPAPRRHRLRLLLLVALVGLSGGTCRPQASCRCELVDVESGYF